MRHLSWTERQDLNRIEADEGLDAFFHQKSHPAPGDPSPDPPPPLHPLPAASIAGMLNLCGNRCRRRNHSNLIPNLSLHAPAGLSNPAGERKETMTYALTDAKHKVERADNTGDQSYATFLVSSATAHALIAIAERLDKILEALNLEHERREL